MAVPITSFDDFMDKFESLKNSRDLFAFFLFDDRPSNKAVEYFADSEFAWLNSLAAAAQMFFFIFLRREKGTDRIANPSLEVANMFGISPREIPGVVLFTLSEDKESVSKGVYLPIKAKLFTDDIDHVEDVFSDLFSVIQECRQKTSTPAELLTILGEEVEKLNNSEHYHPILKYLQETAMVIVNIPRSFIPKLESAFADEIARRALGG